MFHQPDADGDIVGRRHEGRDAIGHIYTDGAATGLRHGIADGITRRRHGAVVAQCNGGTLSIIVGAVRSPGYGATDSHVGARGDGDIFHTGIPHHDITCIGNGIEINISPINLIL